MELISSCSASVGAEVSPTEIFTQFKCFLRTELRRFFTEFKCIEVSLHWPQHVWAIMLQCEFTDKSQEACSAFSAEYGLVYKKLSNHPCA